MKSTAMRLCFTLAACAALVSGMVTACSGSKSGNDAGTAPPKIDQLKSVYGLTLTADDAHKLKEEP